MEYTICLVWGQGVFSSPSDYQHSCFSHLALVAGTRQEHTGVLDQKAQTRSGKMWFLAFTDIKAISIRYRYCKDPPTTPSKRAQLSLQQNIVWTYLSQSSQTPSQCDLVQGGMPLPAEIREQFNVRSKELVLQTHWLCPQLKFQVQLADRQFW